MAKKKAMKKKKAAGKKLATKKKATAKKAATKKAAARATARRARKPARASRATRQPPREISSGGARSSLGSGVFETAAPPLQRRGLGQDAAGQAGDVQGLSRAEDVDSESVEELVEEGQGFEADAISGVENAPDADEGEVRVHERSEDEFPLEEEE